MKRHKWLLTLLLAVFLLGGGAFLALWWFDRKDVS